LASPTLTSSAARSIASRIGGVASSLSASCALPAVGSRRQRGSVRAHRGARPRSGRAPRSPPRGPAHRARPQAVPAAARVGRIGPALAAWRAAAMNARHGCRGPTATSGIEKLRTVHWRSLPRQASSREAWKGEDGVTRTTHGRRRTPAGTNDRVAQGDALPTAYQQTSVAMDLTMGRAEPSDAAPKAVLYGGTHARRSA
jgi:hypothetical protein